MNAIFEKVRAAVEADPSIVVSKADIDTAEGVSEEYMQSLGLHKALLKKLQRGGVALRGYKPTEEGYRVRWMLLRD